MPTDDTARHGNVSGNMSGDCPRTYFVPEAKLRKTNKFGDRPRTYSTTFLPGHSLELPSSLMLYILGKDKYENRVLVVDIKV